MESGFGLSLSLLSNTCAVPGHSLRCLLISPHSFTVSLVLPTNYSPSSTFYIPANTFILYKTTSQIPLLLPSKHLFQPLTVTFQTYKSSINFLCYNLIFRFVFQFVNVPLAFPNYKSIVLFLIELCLPQPSEFSILASLLVFF